MAPLAARRFRRHGCKRIAPAGLALQVVDGDGTDIAWAAGPCRELPGVRSSFKGGPPVSEILSLRVTRGGGTAGGLDLRPKKGLTGSMIWFNINITSEVLKPRTNGSSKNTACLVNTLASEALSGFT